MQKISIIAFMLFITVAAMGQKTKVWNKPLYDAYPYHFGFSFTTGMLDFSYNPSDALIDNDSVYSVEGTPGAVFGASMVTNLRLGDNFDLRFLPGLLFGQRKLTYHLNEKTYLNPLAPDSSFVYHTMNIESTILQFPLLLKYRATRENNYRPYVVVGANYFMDLATRKKIPEEEVPKIRLKRNDILMEIGVGVDSYLPYFKFSTELKFSYGLLNIAADDGTELTKIYDRLGNKMLTLSIYFE